MATLAELKEQALCAVADSDWSTALNVALRAQALIAMTPDAMKQGPAGGHMQWRGEDIERFVKQMRVNADQAALSASGGMTSAKINYQQPSGCGLTEDGYGDC